MSNFIKMLIKHFIALVLFPLKFIINRGNVIILQTYSPFIYCENTKYLYEYLSTKTDFEVYWVTERKEIQKYLDSKGFKYISKSNIFRLIYITLRTKCVIDSGTWYFDIFNLITRDVIKITTMHGNGPKVTVKTNESIESNEEINKLKKFDYVNYPSHFSINKIGKEICQLQSDKIINLGYPRCDHLFNDKFVQDSYAKKEVTKQLCKNYASDGRIILYTPTWRPYKYDFPLLEMENFNCDVFDRFLVKENIYLFYTVHSINIPSNLPRNLLRIKYINQMHHPFFDINKFMLEIDILLGDYSTTSTDFALLGRPQIFYMPDYDRFNLDNGFVEDYRTVLPGREICTYNEFKSTIIECLNEPNNYVMKYQDKMNLLLNHYYDVENSKSCMLFTEFIKSIVKT